MGAWQEIVDYTVPSNTTSVVLNSFGTITKDDFVKVVMTNINNGASVTNLAMRVTGTTNSNYHLQVLRGDGSTVGANRANTMAFDETLAGKTSTVVAYVKLSENDRLNTFTNTTKTNDSGINTMFLYNTSSGATFPSGITSLTFDSGISNGIGTGSRIQIYKLAAEKVADITVASNTTQVDISNLSIDKDSEYLLVSDLVAGVNFARYRLTPNDLTTESGYWSQLIYAGGSTKAASRGNSPEFGDGGASAGIVSLIHTHIKLSNIGSHTAQSYELRNVGSTEPLVINHFTSSTSEAITSITKLNVFSNMTNGIGAGTRFHLYKLY